MTDTEIFDSVVSFIISEYWGKKNKFTLNTTLEKDLGISGDDGSEFLEKFLNEFKIDYDADRVDPGKYFGDEGFGLIDFRIFFGKKRKGPFYDLTIGHLIEVVKRGQWFDMT